MFQQVRRTAAGGALCAALALLAAGCGGSDEGASGKQAPSEEFATSVRALGDTDALTATLSLDASKADLLAINAGEPKDDQIDARTAGLIAGAELVFAVKTTDGTTLNKAAASPSATKSAKTSLFALTADVGGADVFDLRSVKGVLYARANVDKIVSLAGKKQPDLDAIKAAIPPGLGFATAALNGEWISLSLADLGALGKQFGGAVPQPSSSAQTRAFLDRIQGILSKDVTVTRLESGNDGDHLRLAGNARALVGDLVAAFNDVVPANPATAGFDPTDVPDKDVHLDAFVKDGALSALSLDLTQFASGKDAQHLAGKKLPLRIDFQKKADDIAAPDHATKVDLQNLLQNLGPLLSGSPVSGSAASQPAA